MTRQDFKKLVGQGIVFLDGATGTNLQKAGMPVGVCPEQWILEHPEHIVDLQRKFVDAGTNIVYAPTFTGNRIKLAEYGLEDQLREMNIRLVQLSKEAVGGRALVAGDMTMTGQQLYPMGRLTFEELVDVYKEQARALEEGGADLYVVETMMSLEECRAAVLAIRETNDLPVMVTMTFEEDGRSLYGTPPECVPVVLQGMGVDAVGVNCSTGPEAMARVVAKMYAYSNLPIIAKPNDGLPELINGETIYRTTPEAFAEEAKALVSAGARIVGGCCGTTPEHIRALCDTVSGMEPLPVRAEKRRVLSSERRIYEVIPNETFGIIGERINPTGKKKLQEELRAGSLKLVRQMAKEQDKNGASVLDVNMGTNGIDEKQMMLDAVYEISGVTDLPLCIDSSFPEVIEAALRIYPGRALINSISFETEKFRELIPVAKKYGAMFIFLPVSDAGIPKTIEEKHRIIREGVARADAAGIDREDIVVDALVGTIGADKNAALSCKATFEFCSGEMNLPTVCGLSNISFGLPDRIYVNTAFLTMAVTSGLTLAIANPQQDMLMNAAFAANMLMNRPGSDLGYIQRMKHFDAKENEKKTAGEALLTRAEDACRAAEEVLAAAQNAFRPGKNKGARKSSVAAPAVPGGTEKEKEAAETSEKENGGAAVPPLLQEEYQGVLDGERDSIIGITKKTLASGARPDDIINGALIPAINRVGDLFNAKEYFLPQLIASANTMQDAISYLEPMLEKKSGGPAPATIVIATVEGDVHDIGKNLVVLMLKNYGYHVIDLGKDVPAETIVDAALENDAAVIGLSALMTTTMMRMKDVISLAKEKHYPGKIIIGGAAVTQSFADEIGADGYSEDAAACVVLVGKLLGK